VVWSMYRLSQPKSLRGFQRTRQTKYLLKLVRLGLLSDIPFTLNTYPAPGTMTKSFDDIILQLERAGNDLTDLAGYVGNFVNWWSDMKIGLGSLQSSIPLIKLDGSNPLRQEVVLKRWQRFRGQYVQYQRRVREIQSLPSAQLTIGLNR
jgi:hypothetical protein